MVEDAVVGQKVEFPLGPVVVQRRSERVLSPRVGIIPFQQGGQVVADPALEVVGIQGCGDLAVHYQGNYARSSKVELGGFGIRAVAYREFRAALGRFIRRERRFAARFYLRVVSFFHRDHLGGDTVFVGCLGIPRYDRACYGREEK